MRRAPKPPNVGPVKDGRWRARVQVGTQRPAYYFWPDADTSRTGVLSTAQRRDVEQWVQDTRTRLGDDRAASGARAPLQAGRPHHVTAGTLDEDAPRFLRRIEGRASYKADRSHLRACLVTAIRRTVTGPLVVIGTLHRAALTTEDVDVMIASWRTQVSAHAVRRVRVTAYDRAGVHMPAHERAIPATSGRVVASKTIRHRLRVLSELYDTLGGAPNPVEGCKRPANPKPNPVGVDEAVMLAVAVRLAQAARPRTRVRPAHDPAAWLAREQARQRDHQQTYARYVVLVTTGQRPCQVMRTDPEDLDLARATWMVRSAKGAPAHTIILTTEMQQAWQAFSAADAWGAYDTTVHANRLHRAGWPHGIRPYNARHTLVMDALNNRGVDLADVQGVAGHETLLTTRSFYGPLAIGRQRQVAARLEGRLAEMFTLKAVN